jgi:predicted DNA repair protein MutK
LTTAIFFGLNGLILKLASGWLRFRDNAWTTAYKTAGLASIASFLLSLIPIGLSAANTVPTRFTAFFINLVFTVANAAIFIYLIYRMYYTKFSKSFLAWLIIFIINIILGFIIGLIIAALAVAFAFNAARFI